MDLQSKIDKVSAKLKTFNDGSLSLEVRIKDGQEACDLIEVPMFQEKDPKSIDLLLDICNSVQQVLGETQPTFIQEFPMNQIRRLSLEMLQKLPNTELMRPHAKNILGLLFRLLEYDNEENVQICLKLVMEYHKTFKPPFSNDALNFLKFVRTVYKELHTQEHRIFEAGKNAANYCVRDIALLDIHSLMLETFTKTQVTTEVKKADGTNCVYTFLPKCCYSLRVMHDVPLLVVLLYQLYKNQETVLREVNEFVPLVLNFINVEPTQQQKELMSAVSVSMEIFVEFFTAQIKTFSLLAFIVKLFTEQIHPYHKLLVSGTRKLLKNCPNEVAALRKELLIAFRHILSADLKKYYVSMIDELLNKDLLLGTGFTVLETQRPIAYSTLADLIHHTRNDLSVSTMATATELFATCLHDDTLSHSIQIMSLKLMLNLVEFIRTKSDKEERLEGREILMRIFAVIVQKFKVVAQRDLELLKSLCVVDTTDPRPSELTDGSSGTVAPLTAASSKTPSASAMATGPESKPKLTFYSDERPAPVDPVTTVFNPYSTQSPKEMYQDMRALVKILIQGIKTVAWNINMIAFQPPDNNPKQLRAKEVRHFVDLAIYAFQALDVFVISYRDNQLVIRPPHLSIHYLKTKEDKDIMDHLGGVYTMLSPVSFREIFATVIDYYMERTKKNSAIQLLAQTFLAYPTISSSFASLLLDYLLRRLDELGHNSDVATLYLKLFKLVFSSVSLLPAENEQMLKPHLRTLVNSSIRLAKTSKEPYNYFLLLRALFRSIGGGNHDMLYQEFLPLLPNLLQTLNNFQSWPQRGQMKDLFIELCLTVPVRLSSLLPYLNLLMDPLVSALNGSQALVSQGLRTLELCVDNLQPDFLYDQIHPVRAGMMQALWQAMRSQHDLIRQAAFRILGKFGGSNRRTLHEYQSLTPSKLTNLIDSSDSDSRLLPVDSVAMLVRFGGARRDTDIPIGELLITAKRCLAGQLELNSPSTLPYYRLASLRLVKAFLASVFSAVNDLSILESTTVGSDATPVIGESDACPALSSALTAALLAASQSELRHEAAPLAAFAVRRVAIMSTAAVRGGGRAAAVLPIFAASLIEAVAEVLGDEEKQLAAVGFAALNQLHAVCLARLGGDADAVRRLPVFSAAAERCLRLCYARSWFAKSGGCCGLRRLMSLLGRSFLLSRQADLAKALLFVLADLSSEIGQGAPKLAEQTLKSMARMLCQLPGPNLALTEEQKQQQAVSEAAPLLTVLAQHLANPNDSARQASMATLTLIGQLTGQQVSALLAPLRAQHLDDCLPPARLLKQHMLAQQVAIVDCNRFCSELTPPLVTLDPDHCEHHKAFLTDLIKISESSESALKKQPCYANAKSLTQLKCLVAKLLASLSFAQQRDSTTDRRIFEVLFQEMCSDTQEIHETAFVCLQKFWRRVHLDVTLLQQNVKPILSDLRNWLTMTTVTLQRLAYCTRLYSGVFSERLCDSLQSHLQPLLDALVNAYKTNSQNLMKDVMPKEMLICIKVLDIFHLIPSATSKYIEPLCKMVLDCEKMLHIEPSSPLRQPLLRFLLRFPQEFLMFSFKAPGFNDCHYRRFFLWCLRQEDSTDLRRHVANSAKQLTEMLQKASATAAASGGQLPAGLTDSDPRYFILSIVNTVKDKEPDLLLGQTELVNAVLQHWVTAGSAACWAPRTGGGGVGLQQQQLRPLTPGFYSESDMPEIVVEILLYYYKHNLEEFDLLFQLLRCYLDSSVCNFHFFTSFLSEQCQTASPAWKRAVFLKFRDIHKDRAWASQVQLKCKILQYVVIPSVSYSFDKGQQEALIGGPPEPDSASGDNLVAVFVRDFLTDATTPEPDALRVLILQLACVFVEKASPWIHDANNKRQQGVALHRLMTYAWPCVLSNLSATDPLAKFHGHLLLAHIIAKFAINKRIVVQVFHGLLKSFQPEPKRVVTAALDILTPVMTSRLEDDPSILQHWTKKILLEDTAAGSTQNYQHILSLIVRHHDVYYAIRHSLMTNILQGLSKFGLASNNVSAEHRKLALELIETVMKWDLRQRTEAEAQRNQPQQSSQQEQQLKLEDTQSSSCDTKSLMSPSSSSSSPLPAKRARLSATSTAAAASAAAASAVSSASSTLSGDQQPSGSATSAAGAAAAAAAASKPFDKCTKDQIVYALMRFAVYIVDGNVNNLGNELWTKRPIQLIQTLLSPEWWPDTDLKLSFFDRILNVPLETRGANSVQTAQMNASLEVLRVLFDHLDRSALLTSMRLLSKGLCNCLRQASNPRAVKLMGPIVTRVFSLFPPESDQLNQFTKHSELVEFYMTIYKAILDGFSHYERTSVTNSPATAQLFASIMLLKATQADGNYVIVDRVITHFGKLLNRMAKETFNATATDTGAYMTDMLITSFDIVKCRLNSMSVDTRRSFLQLLLHLIEKSSDTKLLKAIVSLIREWICVTRPEDQASAPVPKERCQLLMKVMSNISNSRIRDEDIIDEFLEAVYTVYSVPYYKNQEMFGKLEQAFCMGVDSGKPAIRNKFMRVYMSEVFEGPHANSLQSRLLFIVASHRWDKMGSCFWIPIAFEIFVRAALPEARVRLAQPGRYLGGAATGAESASSSSGPVVKQEAGLESEFAALAESDAKLFYCDQQDSVTGAPSTEADSKDDSKVADDDDMTGANAAQESLFPYEDPARLGTLLARDAQVMSELSDVTNALLLDGMAALCYVDHQLADSLFVSTFPKLWSLITESTTSAPGGQDVSRQLIPYVRKFIASGIHSHQMDVHPSSLRTFVSGVTKCPDITRTIPHPVLCYLGSQFHMWHECTLLLEHYYYGNSRVKRGAFETASSSAAVSTGSAGEFASDYEEGLLQIYSEMREEDYLAAIWSVRAPCEEMVKAVSYAQFGLFQQAVEAGEDALDRKFSNPTDAIMKDRFIEEHYLSYLRQLNRWAELPRFAQAFNCCNHRLVAECDWKLSDWRNMHNALSQLGNEYPRRDKWRIELLWGYWHLCGKARSDHADYVSPTLPQHVERFFKLSVDSVIKEWRRLPALVSAVHVPYLQATQQVMELHEASGIYATLNNVSYGRTPVTTTSLIHDMKSIIKTWKNRVPVIMDDLTHWHEVIQWRQHLFHEVHRTVSSSFVQDNPMQNHLKMIALHSFVTAMIQFAKVARKHHLYFLSMDAVEKLQANEYNMAQPSYLKIKQDFKSRLDIVDSRKENILEAVEFMEKTSIKFFNAMEKAEFFSYKGVFFAMLNKGDEANKNFSMAIQLNDTVYRVWMHYGDFLEHVFTKDAPSRRDQNAILNGTYAIQCFMEAAKAQSECKARRPIAKSIWLLSFDDATGSLAKCFEERTANVQPSHFLAWINNLLVALLGVEGKHIVSLLIAISRQFPVPLYLPVRQLCAALKAEPNSQQPLWRCSNVLHRAKDFHAATLNAYEALCDGLSSLSLDWQHNALNQLRRLFDSAVSAAAAAAADADSSDMPIPTEVSALLTETLKDFGGVEELLSDPEHAKLRSELSSDPELQPATGSLQSAIRCLSRKWLPTIESRARRLPRAFLLADRAPQLANFVAPALADPSAELELPGEQLDGKPVQHWVKVHSVLPSVRVLLRNGCAVRCVQLRGTNGRVYSYLLEQDSASSATPPPALASWREASVGHLTRLINWILAKEKEPARRLLQAAAPKCVDLGGGHRLTEDSGRPLSLLDAHRAANPAPEPDRPLVRWLLDRRLATTAAQLPARDLLEELIGDVGPDLLLQRCLAELAGPSEFFTFRRVVTGQLGLLGLLEMTLGLEKANPDRLLLQLDTGRASVTRQVWSSSVAATVGSFASQAADSQPPTAVPFRLTPNLCELISPLGIRGPLQAAIIASARCLVLPKYQLAAYLRCVLRDEVILTYRQANGGACPEADALTQSVGQAVSAILARLQALAAFEGAVSVVPDYVKAASDLDNLAAMPAAYQPWL